ncbi:WXG100 family type VII secretion target [Candidatus Contubernalis alkaliaceticus]|uniref:WXG100 family type VII secretion target n=1 Tax=Candidatus Contubernalis alkaliaceticus TaxID=338645 RepID=UPI001F4C2F06|nr:WXG100 family type VII secretion target [Candidatus Contubernalis alkalaceticus]UNC91118.1 WXG100 family type VII secretion target [Candidatus Contubernalis alkalaceticus]
MPGFKITDVDSTAIQNTSSSIDEDIHELLSISAVLSGDIMKDLNPYWQGTAKDSFEKQLNNYVKAFNKLAGTYENLNKQLKASGSTYKKAGDSVMQRIMKIPR